MPVLLNGRSGITCTIGGLDLSKELVNFNGSYSSLNLPSAGLSLMTGSLTITQGEDTNLDFDTRFSPLWRRGTEIDLTHNGRPLPIVGKSFIITADYDMASSLSISFGCVLSLYNFRTTSDTGVCLEFGEQVSVGNLLIDMLTAAGVPPGIIDTGSFIAINQFSIAEPLLIGSTQSIIQAAGTIAGQYGAIIVQRPGGNVSLIYVNDDLQYIHTNKAEDLQTYTRTSLPETIIKKITFNYNQQTLCSELGAATKSIRSGDTVVNVEESIDTTLRTTSTILNEFRDINNVLTLISTTTTNSVFEPPTQEYLSVNRGGSIQSLSTCFPDDAARIISREIISESDNTEIVKAWISAKNTAGANASSFSISGVITSSRTEELYEYLDTTITKTTTQFQPRAVAIPLTGDLTLGRGSGSQITDIDPTTLIPFERTIEIYSRPQEACQKWSYTRTVYRNRNVVTPEEISLQVQDLAVPIQSIVDNGEELIPIDRVNEFNQSEPSFETFQVDREIANTPLSIIVGSGIGSGSEFEVEDEIDLGDFFIFNRDYFEEYGSRIMDFRNGRILGMEVSLGAWLIEEWDDFLPLSRSKIVEPSNLRIGVASVLSVDSPSIVGAAEEVVISYTGSFVAFSNDVNNTNAFSDILNNPTTLPDSNPIQSFEALPLSYSIDTSFNFTYTP